jgi:single-stranded DNA-binding protein
VNSVNVVGTLSRAPAVKFEGDGLQICTFTLSVAEPSREGKPYSLYVPCAAWGKSAETCSLLNAGDLVALVGKLAWSKRIGKCGQEHSVLVVSVRECCVLETAAEMPA